MNLRLPLSAGIIISEWTLASPLRCVEKQSCQNMQNVTVLNFFPKKWWPSLAILFLKLQKVFELTHLHQWSINYSINCQVGRSRSPTLSDGSSSWKHLVEMREEQFSKVKRGWAVEKRGVYISERYIPLIHQYPILVSPHKDAVFMSWPFWLA